MAQRFTDLRDKIRDWANRDQEALSDTIIEDTMGWAADKAYRTLRIPPLEAILEYHPILSQDQLNNGGVQMQPTYTNDRAGNLYQSATRLTIPADLIEFIQIRTVDANGQTVRVFNEKADIRTFRDVYAEKYSDLAFWTRQAGEILMSPAVGNTGTGFGSTGVGNEERVELYYYRRLPSLNARYDVTLSNYNAGLLAFRDAMGVETDIDAPSPAATSLPTPPTGSTIVGQEVDNWLRDENERIIIFGALAECFAYLQEDDQVAKYGDMFFREIDELNKEDQMRTGSGGNVQVNFNGRGLI